MSEAEASEPSEAADVTEAEAPDVGPDVDAPEDSVESEAAETEEPRRYTVKIDGEDIEVDEEELRNGYGRMRASTKRFEEAAKLRKEAESQVQQIRSLVHQLKSDPLKVLPHLGVDVENTIASYVEQMIAEQEMPEDERTRRQLEAEREKLRKEREEFERGKQQREFQKQAIAYRDKFMGNITEAFKLAGVEMTEEAAAELIPRAAQVATTALDAGHEMTPKEMADLVLEYDGQRRGRYTKSFAALEGDALLEALGEDVAEKIYRAKLNKVKQMPAKPIGSTGKNTGKKSNGEAPSRRVDGYSDYQSFWDKRQRQNS